MLIYSTFLADSPEMDTSGGETDGDTEHASEDEVEVSPPEISQNHQVISESF